MSSLRCSRCSFAGSHPKDLLRHAKNVHAIPHNAFPCPDCRLCGYDTKKNLNRHRRNGCWGSEWIKNWFANKTPPHKIGTKPMNSKKNKLNETEAVISKGSKTFKISSSDSDKLPTSPKKGAKDVDKLVVLGSKKGKSNRLPPSPSSQSDQMSNFATVARCPPTSIISESFAVSIPSTEKKRKASHIRLSSQSSNDRSSKKVRSRLQDRFSLERTSISLDLAILQSKAKTTEKDPPQRQPAIAEAPSGTVRVDNPAHSRLRVRTLSSSSLSNKSDTRSINVTPMSPRGHFSQNSSRQSPTLVNTGQFSPFSSESSGRQLRLRPPPSSPLSTSSGKSLRLNRVEGLSSLSKESVHVESKAKPRGQRSPPINNKSDTVLSPRDLLLKLKSSLLPAMEIPHLPPKKRLRSASPEINGVAHGQNSKRAVSPHISSATAAKQQKEPNITLKFSENVFSALLQEKTKVSSVPLALNDCKHFNPNSIEEHFTKKSVSELSPIKPPVFDESCNLKTDKTKLSVEPVLFEATSGEPLSNQLALNSMDLKQPDTISCAKLNTEANLSNANVTELSNSISTPSAVAPVSKANKDSLEPLPNTTVVNSCAESTPSKKHSLGLDFACSKVTDFPEKSINDSTFEITTNLDAATQVKFKQSLFELGNDFKSTVSSPPPNAKNIDEKEEIFSAVSSPFELSFFDEQQEEVTKAKSAALLGILNDTQVSSPLESSIENDDIKLAQQRKLNLLISVASFTDEKPVKVAQSDQRPVKSPASAKKKIPEKIRVKRKKRRFKKDASLEKVCTQQKEELVAENGDGLVDPIVLSLQNEATNVSCPVALTKVSLLDWDSFISAPPKKMRKLSIKSPPAADASMKKTTSTLASHAASELPSVQPCAYSSETRELRTLNRSPASTSVQRKRVKVIDSCDEDNHENLTPPSSAGVQGSESKISISPRRSCSDSDAKLDPDVSTSKFEKSSKKRTDIQFGEHDSSATTVDTAQSCESPAQRLSSKVASSPRAKISRSRHDSDSESEDATESTSSDSKQLRDETKDVCDPQREEKSTAAASSLSALEDPERLINVEVCDTPVDCKQPLSPASDVSGLEPSTSKRIPLQPSNPSANGYSDLHETASVPTVATSPCTLLSTATNEHDESSSLFSSCSDLSVVASKPSLVPRRRGRPPLVHAAKVEQKVADSSCVATLRRRRKRGKVKLITSWRCPGCSKTAPVFPSAVALLAHLPLCHKRNGGQASSTHSPNRGLRLVWPTPLSLPGAGFGCAICGLLVASESRLDKHRRDAHETAKPKV